MCLKEFQPGHLGCLDGSYDPATPLKCEIHVGLKFPLTIQMWKWTKIFITHSIVKKGQLKKKLYEGYIYIFYTGELNNDYFCKRIQF